MPLAYEEEVAQKGEIVGAWSKPEAPLGEGYRSIKWLLPVLFGVVMLVQLTLCGRRLSQSADEATHLYAGYRYLKCSDVTISPEHPPFAKALAAAPLVAMKFAVDCAPAAHGDALHQAFESLNWLYTQDWPRALARGREAISLFGVGLCALVWLSASRMFGFRTAILANLLLIFEPNVLGYAALVLTDVPVTCMLFLSVFAFYLWTQRRSLALLVLTSVAVGLTLLTKQSGVAIVPILGTLTVTDALLATKESRCRWRLLGYNLCICALICAIAGGVVWIGYSAVAARSSAPEFQVPQPPVAGILSHVLTDCERLHLLPQAYLRSFAWALSIPSGASASFVAGKIYVRAPWFATAFNFMVRSTPAMLVMIVLGTIGVAVTDLRRRRELLFVLIPGAVYLAICLQANRNVSVRYLLPVLPFVLIGAAAGCVELAKRGRWMMYVLLCLVALHAASSLHAYPNYLSYASELWGGPSQAYKYEPWMDTGQAYLEAREYLEQHPSTNCWFISAWQWDPGIYDVPCQATGLYLPHEIPPRVHGTVIVSSTLLTDVRLADHEIATGFSKAIPVAHIGGSALLVYEGDFDTSAAAAAGESSAALRALSVGSVSEAIEHARTAVQLSPSSALTHATLCRVLSYSQIHEALKECRVSRDLLLTDPLRWEDSRKKQLELMEKSIIGLRSGSKD